MQGCRASHLLSTTKGVISDSRPPYVMKLGGLGWAIVIMPANYAYPNRVSTYDEGLLYQQVFLRLYSTRLQGIYD